MLSPDPLDRVKRAASRRRRAELEHRAAIVEAAAGGATLEAIANAAGTTRQAVSQLLQRVRARG